MSELVYKAVDKAVRAATRSAARVFLRRVRQVAPVRTGHLRAHIRMYRTPSLSSGQIGYTVGVISQAVPYWSFLEVGYFPRKARKFTRNVRPRRLVQHPFFAPSFEQAEGEAVETFEQVLDEELRALP